MENTTATHYHNLNDSYTYSLYKALSILCTERTEALCRWCRILNKDLIFKFLMIKKRDCPAYTRDQHPLEFSGLDFQSRIDYKLKSKYKKYTVMLYLFHEMLLAYFTMA
jgi:hypothetical protein